MTDGLNKKTCLTEKHYKKNNKRKQPNKIL